MAKYVHRWIESQVSQYLSFMRIVHIRGARQCGKTTLVRQQVKADVLYRTLDDPTTLNSAKQDPVHFLRHQSSTMIIDEIQKAPHLIAALKQEVDERPGKGRFLITGSSDVFSQSTVSESLAGRIANLQLSSLTVGEQLGTTPQFLSYCRTNRFPDMLSSCSKEMVVGYALQGGYPEVIMLPPQVRGLWMQQYVDTLLTHELVHIAAIERQAVMRQLVTTLASYSSKALNISQIAGALGISRPTLHAYCSYLEQLYLFTRIPSYTQTEYAKVGKLETWFALDSGLLASVLKWEFGTVMQDAAQAGKLVETFVFHELFVQLSLQHDYTLYRYRDHEKHEIDFLLEKDDQLVGLEVKAGETVRSYDFKHMLWFRDSIAKKPFVGIVLYCGSQVLSFGPSLWAVPISVFWS